MQSESPSRIARYKQKDNKFTYFPRIMDQSVASHLWANAIIEWVLVFCLACTSKESEVTLEPSTSTLQIPELKMISDAVHQATSDKDKFNKSQRVFHEDSAEHCLEFSDWMLEQFY